MSVARIARFLWLALAGLLVGVTRLVPAQEAWNIKLVGQIGGSCRIAELAGNYAYLREGPALDIVDVSNPSSPLIVGRFVFSSRVGDVFISSGKAYVLSGSGLEIIDISRPASPTLVGLYPGFLPSGGTAVCVSGNLAYVTTFLWPGSGALRIINVANPSSPSLVGSCQLPPNEFGERIQVSGALAYVATDTFSYDTPRLRVFDLSNPSSPTLRGSYRFSSTPGDFCVLGGLGYFPIGTGLQILDLTTPSSPILRGSCGMPSYAIAVRVVGSLAYVADLDKGLQIIDVSDSARPRVRGAYDTPGKRATSVRVLPGLAYVADEENGLYILNVTNPASPTLRASYRTGGYAAGVCVVGSRVYVAGGLPWQIEQVSGGSLAVIDATNPSWPGRLGSCATPFEAQAVDVSGNLAYVAMWYDNLWGTNPGTFQIFDVSNPALPKLRGTYNTGAAHDVRVVGNLAYVATEKGLRILDVSNPSSPTLRGSYNAVSWHFDVVNNLVFHGGWIINASDPTSPTWAGTYYWGGVVHVNAGRAYVLAGEEGLQIVDVSKPSATKILGSYPCQWNPHEAPGSVYADGGLAYVASGYDGVRVIDVSNPTSPTLVGFFPNYHYAQAVVASGGLIYVADSDAGLLILRYSPPVSSARETWALYE